MKLSSGGSKRTEAEIYNERATILLAAALGPHGNILPLTTSAEGPPVHHRPHRRGCAPPAVLQEDYVRRNCSRAEIEQIISNPEFLEAARERLGESFRESEEFKL
jgi:hypothetical protein